MQSSTNSGKAACETVDKVLGRARRALGSRLEADLLACRAWGRERSWLYAHGRDPVEPDALAAFERLVAERVEGKPVAQLCGQREFYGRDFAVDNRVLIPRPETELLVDLALTLPLPPAARICDVGTGSGCVAVTLAAERPHWHLTAIDCSKDALAVAGGNRDRLCPGRVDLLCGDLLAPVGDRRFDLIVSNPPYVAEDDPHLERGDPRFEPRQALVGGVDGLDVIRRLVAQARDRLEAGGWLLIEHGHDQAAAVRSLLEEAGLSNVASQRDLAGIERASLGSLAE